MGGLDACLSGHGGLVSWNDCRSRCASRSGHGLDGPGDSSPGFGVCLLLVAVFASIEQAAITARRVEEQLNLLEAAAEDLRMPTIEPRPYQRSLTAPRTSGFPG